MLNKQLAALKAMQEFNRHSHLFAVHRSIDDMQVVAPEGAAELHEGRGALPPLIQRQGHEEVPDISQNTDNSGNNDNNSGTTTEANTDTAADTNNAESRREMFSDDFMERNHSPPPREREILTTDDACKLPSVVRVGDKWTWELCSQKVSEERFHTYEQAMTSWRDHTAEWRTATARLIMDGFTVMSAVTPPRPEIFMDGDGVYGWRHAKVYADMYNTRDEARAALLDKHIQGVSAIVSSARGEAKSVKSVGKAFYGVLGEVRTPQYKTKEQAKERLDEL